MRFPILLLALAPSPCTPRTGRCGAAPRPATWSPMPPTFPPTSSPVKSIPTTEAIDLATAKNILWTAKLGSQTYGNPSSAAARSWSAPTTRRPATPTQKGDRGNLMCFDEKTGSFLWQLIVPKLGAGKVSDWEFVGLCSSPAIVGDRAWLITNRGELVCLDLKGMANGNDGPFKDEAKYMTADPAHPVVPGDQHADILWKFDMREELGIFPHNVSSCSPLVVNGIVYTATSNGMDWSHTNIPAPLAPSLVAVDANTGKLVGEEISGVANASSTHPGPRPPSARSATAICSSGAVATVSPMASSPNRSSTRKRTSTSSRNSGATIATRPNTAPKTANPSNTPPSAAPAKSSAPP